MLRRCVRSILSSDHPSFEVVVADQSPEPADLGDDPRVRHLHLGSRGKSAALNEGVAAAAAPLLAFTDDDCTVPTRWLPRGAEVFDHHPEVGMLFGDLRPYEHDPTKWLVPGGALERFRIRSGLSAVLSRGGPGANCFARRSACLTVGPWDELMGPGTKFESCEEFDFYYRAAAAGVVVARVPALEVVHWGRRSWADGSADALLDGYAYGEGAVVGKHLHLGDARALWHLVSIYAAPTLGVLRHPRTADTTRLRLQTRGLCDAFKTPVDRRTRTFRFHEVATANGGSGLER